ncbi:MAG: GAF domain-containing protein [Armatimonadota bacterium]|nr:GAF domain-containing protein [bacterium]
MLKGIAKSDGDGLPEDRYGIVVALSHLSKTLSEANSGSAFVAAAEAGATLLRVKKAVVFVRTSKQDDASPTSESDQLSVAGSIGVDGDEKAITFAREIAEQSFVSSGPITYPGGFKRNPSTELKHASIRAAMGVPMRVGETPLGAFVVMSDKPHVFSPSDIELAHVVASQAALAAWRTSFADGGCSPEVQDELIGLANRKIRELSLVNQVSEAVNSTLDLDKLLDIALEQSMAAVGADAGSLMLVNEETNKLEIVASRGIARKFVERTQQPVGTSIAGWVAEHGESVLVSDARDDSRFQMPFFRDYISSSASVPLKVKGSVIGVLNVNTIRPDRVFDERDLELMGTVANQMAVAIENARLYARVNRRTKQLDSLLEISRTVTSTLNLDEVMHRVSETLCTVLQLDVCAILLFDDLSERFRFGHGIGLKTRRKYVYHDLAAPLANKVRATGQKLICRDVNASRTLRTEISKSEGLKAAICVPLKHHGHLVGVAAAFAHEPRLFAKSQKDILRPIGELAGIAIRHARVYRQKFKIAEILQQRLVPAAAPQFDGLDIGHKFLPAQEVGGDYYDFIDAGPGRLGIALGDVSGSDVEAAEYTTMGKHVLRVYAREYESPAQVLMKTNDMVCEDTRSDMFISLFYGVVDTKAKKLTYANAGCEPAVHYKARTGKCSLLRADGILLGITQGTEYSRREVRLGQGDIIAAYTDGVTEAGVEGHRFGSQRVMDLIAADANLTAQQIADHLYDVLLKFGHGRTKDDTAMVIIKVQ